MSGELHPRLAAAIFAARYHGIALDPQDYSRRLGEQTPSSASLVAWLRHAGIKAEATRLRWRHLMHFQDAAPVVLLFTNGNAGLLTGADPTRNLVTLKNPLVHGNDDGVLVDELRLAQLWTGESVLLSMERRRPEAERPFTLSWLARLVLCERSLLRDVAFASLTLSFLTIFPPLLIMTVVDRVLTHHSYSTLALLAALLAIASLFELLLGYARRLIVLTVGTRLDTGLNLHVFNRVLRLPLDYFERHPAGETMHKIAEIYKIREFLTGKLLSTFLDMSTLLVLLPFLFFLNSFLATIVVACSALIMVVILGFLAPLRRAYANVVVAETKRAAALTETIFGIKTVKSLAVEPQRKEMWDICVAEAAQCRLAFGKLANWPQTIVTPIERFMSIGVALLGAYVALTAESGYPVGALFAFMMLSMRVAQPLTGLARLIDDYEGVGAAITEVASVLNRPVEIDVSSGGLRPRIVGAISFDDVTFSYAGTRTPALDRVSFSVPAGTVLGVVGRSGSGKSTLTRLLQGINRDYSGFLKLDGTDLREINLRHLRNSFGVVLQENFLFRGSIVDNIVAGRPGLTLQDAVRAARLAGAEEFVERMPNGYATLIEEGSPNLSGGQRQRLAIARALITDPRILILDEATNALDPESEALVSANLLRIARNRTMLVVSHRLSSLIECDQILIMDRGRVVDIAPHRLLIDRCTIYRQLWMQQSRYLDKERPLYAGIAATSARRS